MCTPLSLYIHTYTHTVYRWAPVHPSSRRAGGGRNYRYWRERYVSISISMNLSMHLSIYILTHTYTVYRWAPVHPSSRRAAGGRNYRYWRERYVSIYISVSIYLYIYIYVPTHIHIQYIDTYLSIQAVGERQAGVTVDTGENDMYLSISLYLSISIYIHMYPHIYIYSI